MLNQVDKSDTLNSSIDTQPASVSMGITQSSLAHDGLGARAEDQGGQEEHSGMAAGDDGSTTLGKVKKRHRKDLLQRVAVWCSVVQCVSVCCNVLQCDAMCCIVLPGVLAMSATMNQSVPRAL